MTTSLRVPLLIDGRIETFAADRFESVFNPSTGVLIGETPLCGNEAVDTAVQSCREALPAWANTPIVDRARLMFRYRALLESHFEELALLVTREHGKTIAESRAEVQRGIEMVEFACSIPSLMMGDCLPNIASDVDAETVRHPVGVCVGITPYNFPCMVPLWMFPVATVCGNTFVLKPSEKVPYSAMRLGELLLEAGVPPGILNIVHGGSDAVDALLSHPARCCYFFRRIHTRRGKNLYQGNCQREKSPSSWWCKEPFGDYAGCRHRPDGQTTRSVRLWMCRAALHGRSVAVAVGRAGDPLVEELVSYAGKMKVGPTESDHSVDMGPLIRIEHRNRVASYLDIAKADGAVVALDGRNHESLQQSNGFFVGPSVVDRVASSMRVWKEEIFGPVLSIVRTDDLDEAIDLGNRCGYGNGAVIFTRSGYAARHFKQHFNAGMIGVNVGVPAPMAWFPFTGWNRSFFGDLHIQGTEGIHFYTRQKTVLTRWPKSNDSHLDPIWRSQFGKP